MRSIIEDLKSIFQSFEIKDKYIAELYYYFLQHNKASDIPKVFEELNIPWKEGYISCSRLAKIGLIELKAIENAYYLSGDQARCWDVILNMYTMKNLFNWEKRDNIKVAEGALNKIKDLLQNLGKKTSSEITDTYLAEEEPKIKLFPTDNSFFPELLEFLKSQPDILELIRSKKYRKMIREGVYLEEKPYQEAAQFIALLDSIQEIEAGPNKMFDVFQNLSDFGSKTILHEIINRLNPFYHILLNSADSIEMIFIFFEMLIYFQIGTIELVNTAIEHILPQVDGSLLNSSLGILRFFGTIQRLLVEQNLDYKQKPDVNVSLKYKSIFKIAFIGDFYGLKIHDLTLSEYRCLEILRNESKFISEKDLRNIYGRKSGLSAQLNKLCELGLAERKKEGRIYLYSIT
jgi:predicted transcriptional regulator